MVTSIALTTTGKFETIEYEMLSIVGEVFFFFMQLLNLGNDIGVSRTMGCSFMNSGLGSEDGVKEISKFLELAGLAPDVIPDLIPHPPANAGRLSATTLEISKVERLGFKLRCWVFTHFNQRNIFVC